MSELSRREEALVMPIVVEIAREQGVAVGELRVLLGKKLSTVTRVVQKLVDAGIVERRRFTHQYREASGLWLR